MLSEKKILQEELKKRLDNFIYSPKLKITLPELSTIPSRLFGNSDTYYSKSIEEVGSGFIDFISKDHEPDFFVWRTTPDKLKKAIRSGILNYDSLTTKAISALGQYKRSTNNRSYLSGIISDKYDLKNALLELSQANIEALQPIERLINQYNQNQTCSQNIERIQILLKEYKIQLKQNYDKINSLNIQFENYDPEISNKWQIQYDNLVQQTQDYEQLIIAQNSPESFKSYTSNSLLHFIKQQSVLNIRNVQEINQNIVYSRFSKSFFRGDLHSCCVDALKEVNDFECDYHNPILAEHQGDFSSCDNLIAVNFSHIKKNQTQIDETFMAICQIEGADKLIKDDNNDYFLNKNNGYHYKLESTIYTKWYQQSSKLFIIEKVLSWPWNIAVGIIFGLTFDLFGGLISGLAGYKFESIADKFKFNVINPATTNTHFDKLKSIFKLKKYSLGTLIGFKLVTFCKNIYFELKNGAVTTAKQYKIELWDNLYADYKDGHQTNDEIKSLLNDLPLEIANLEKDYQDILVNIKNKAPTFYNAYTFEENDSLPVMQPFKLTDGEWLDLTNSVISGLKSISDSFTHSIPAKNPFLGLIFCSAYSIAALAIINPSAVKFLPKSYIDLCDTLSKALTKGKSSGAMANAGMQSQVLTGALEALMNGNTSWLAASSKAFENDSSNILILSTLAVSLGYLITFKLNIPYISQHIREELGNVPLPSLGAAGAKVGIVLVHLLEEHEHEISPNKIEDYSQKLNELIRELYKDINESDEKKIEALINEILSKPFLDSTKSLLNNIDMQKFAFLSFLEDKKYFLPNLSQVSKRQILKHVGKLFPEQNNIYRSIESMMDPVKHESIFLITLLTPLNYIPLLLRCLVSPITKSTMPFKDLYNKSHKDLTRIYNALGNAVHGIASLFKIITTSFFEIIVNESFARSEATLNNSHIISHSSYKFLYSYDNQFEKGKTFTGQHLNQQKSQFTHPEPSIIFNNKTSLSCNQHQPNEIEGKHDINFSSYKTL